MRHIFKENYKEFGYIEVVKMDSCDSCGETKMGLHIGIDSIDLRYIEICFECLDNIKKLSGQ
jgi:hypothetical protein